VTSEDPKYLPPIRRRRLGFTEDFKQFFLSGLAAILPTLVTLWLLVWAWNFLWEYLGRHLIALIGIVSEDAVNRGWMAPQTYQHVLAYWNTDDLGTRVLGVILSVLLVYVVGVFVGNLIGRAAWRMAERAVLRLPLVRAIYPTVKQVTDFLLAERSRQFQFSRVVAVQPHEQNIWSIGLITSAVEWTLGEDGPQEMVTVFIPSTPTSFTGYVLIVPRNKVVELPLTVEEALRLLVSGGVITPPSQPTSQAPSISA
jgi:uncharacterized membrane protein